MSSAEKNENDVAVSCSVCAKKDKCTRAEKFCEECDKYFCAACLSIHREFLDGHVTHGPSTPGVSSAFHTDKCDSHPQNMLQLYCRCHDTVVCGICAFIHHGYCTEVTDIAVDIEEIFDDRDVEVRNETLKQAREDLANMKQQKLKDKETISEQYESYVEKIEKYEQKLASILANLSKIAKERARSHHDSIQRKVDLKIADVDSLDNEVVGYQAEMENVASNKPQLFVTLKKGNGLLGKISRMDEMHSEGSKGEHLDIKLNTNVEQYLACFQSLAIVQDGLYKVQNKREISINLADDQDISHISGSCLLSSDSVLLVDSNNKKLKHLDISTNKIVDQCELPVKPTTVCCTGGMIAAVGLSNNTVQIVSYEDKLTPTRSIKMNHDCTGVAYSNNQLFACDGKKCVCVHGLDGAINTILTTIRTNAHAVMVNEDAVYIVDRNQGVVCTNLAGQELFRYVERDIKECGGICTDGQANLFVCCSDGERACVVQLGEEGEIMGELLSLEYLPETVCFDTKGRRLIVPQSETIHVYDLIS